MYASLFSTDSRRHQEITLAQLLRKSEYQLQGTRKTETWKRGKFRMNLHSF